MKDAVSITASQPVPFRPSSYSATFPPGTAYAAVVITMKNLTDQWKDSSYRLEAFAGPSAGALTKCPQAVNTDLGLPDEEQYQQGHSQKQPPGSTVVGKEGFACNAKSGDSLTVVVDATFANKGENTASAGEATFVGKLP